MSHAINEADYARAAKKLGCEVAAIKAVAEVESAGDGFLPTGEPKILFEAHHFSRLTNRKFDKSHPDISSPRWNKALYLGGAREHNRLDKAVQLDRPAALKSASWGKFQIMGFNYNKCGYQNVQQFVTAMYASEGKHLDAFVRFVKSMDLVDEIRRHDWAGFARVYNGASYAANKYDVKMAAAYKRHSK